MSIDIDRQMQFSNLSYKTTEQSLINYFSNYGQIEKLILYKDDQDQSLRKGFFIYKDYNSVNDLMSNRPHFIDNRQIFLQRTMPINQCTNSNYLSESLGINLTVKEVFISRLCLGETKDMFINYFRRFGTIIDCRVFNSYSQNPKQMGYAFLRFDDYDSVDQIILSRPHIINSRFYHIRKSIPREYNYIISSIKPLGLNRPTWRHYGFGLINMQTQAIIYPSLSPYITQTVPIIHYDKQEIASMKKSPTNEFELITPSSLSSSISIVNSTTDDFTPLPSPLYSTAIAYSPTTDII
jgi:hypothetical protein